MIPNKLSSPSYKISGIALSRDNILHIIEQLLDPLIAVCALCVIAIFTEGELNRPYAILSLIVFAITYPSTSKISLSQTVAIKNILFIWSMQTALFVSFGLATQYIYMFPRETLIIWFISVPLLQAAGYLCLKKISPFIIKLQSPTKRAVIVGMNDRANNLAVKLKNSQYNSIKVVGFFEDRELDRVTNDLNMPRLGRIIEIATYVKNHNINLIYLSLPMASQTRILNLLEDLKDTTASIYFVPDMFLTDLIQSRIDQVDGIPIVAVRETPFTGFNGLLKRSADLTFAIIILIIISPLLLLITVAVKLTSPGPVIFKQRRYGLNGEEILVYKFRSMTTCDNGDKVIQATANDQRITKLGAFLRKTSLDELPQFFNVIQGRMSVVGPRPHAVSHNEMYRKVIKGYMIRHKVKPGITGWAQVNGLRGETDTLDKMKTRVDYDIQYLRNWSPALDTYIIFRTIWVVFFKGQKNAY